MLKKSGSHVSYALFVLVALSFLFFGCNKEIVKAKEDLNNPKEVSKRHSEEPKCDDLFKLMAKKWTLTNHNLEIYTDGVVTSTKQENFVGLGFYQEFKVNGTTGIYDLGGLTTGTWKLVSNTRYVLDKNTSGERYYDILSVTATNLVVHGPFNSSHGLYSNYLVTAYYTNP